MNTSRWHQFLDRSIVFSFSNTGFYRHRRAFTPLQLDSLSGKHILLTGGTSGLGLHLVNTLMKYDLRLSILARNESVGSMLEKDFSPKLKYLSCDLSTYREVPKLVKEMDPVDIVINNAGAMGDYQVKKGNLSEDVFASHVLGHYNLTRALVEEEKIQSGGRVIFVASGGMLLQRLELQDLCFHNSPYNKYVAYANAKRAQVILVEELAKLYRHVNFYSTHPGWVATPGVKFAMPWFYKLMYPLLRTPEQGNDTVLWLCSECSPPDSGTHIFDRMISPTHISKKTQETQEDRVALMKLCEEAYASCKYS